MKNEEDSSQKLRKTIPPKKHGQQRYCKGLIHFECLGDGIPNKKTGIQ